MRILAALTDPFLHPWDERYHALVARNLMHDPFKPILRSYPVLPVMNNEAWCCSHLWLHKPPLFMWQMALSMKLFSVSTFTVRLPSVIMGTLLILLIYRIGILIFNDKTVALISATMLAFSNFHLQMIGGLQGMDHNDVAHGFYILASIWAYLENTKERKWYWIILIGFFAGCAILNKWLTGLLVFGVWSAHIAFDFKKRFTKREVFDLLTSLVVCTLVFVPWQLYILWTFPVEAQFEYAFNRRHLTEALEGHAGTETFYLEKLPTLFGSYYYFLIPIGFILTTFKSSPNRKITAALISAILVVFCFFSFIVKTKVDTYLYIVVPLCLMFIAYALNYFGKRISNITLKRIYFIFTISTILILDLKPNEIVNHLSSKNTYRIEHTYNANIYRNLRKYLPQQYKLVMNMNSYEDVDLMFYQNDITAYSWCSSEKDFAELEKRKVPVAVFKWHGGYTLPNYVKKYPYLYIIDVELQNYL